MVCVTQEGCNLNGKEADEDAEVNTVNAKVPSFGEKPIAPYPGLITAQDEKEQE
jgi:hypothetical protein